MKLTIRSLAKNQVIVTTDWTTYTVIFGESQAQVYSLGLEEEFSIDHFPDDAENGAIAAYLITQLEIKSLA